MMEPYNIAELQTAGVELAHAHNAADADRQRHLALQSGTFLLQLSGLLYDERIISAERRAALEALSLEDLTQQLTTHELMDLALQWKVVASAPDFWQLHKHKTDLVAALYDCFAAQQRGYAAAERAHVEEYERARKARLAAAAEAEQAHQALTRPQPGLGARTPPADSPAVRRLSVTDVGRTLVATFLHPDEEALAPAPEAAAAEGAAPAPLTAPAPEAAAAGGAAPASPTADPAAAVAPAPPFEAPVAGAAAVAADGGALASRPPTAGDAEFAVAAAKADASSLAARARELRSPLSNMRKLLLKNLPKLATHLSSGGASAARVAASTFMTSWFARRERQADKLCAEAEAKRLEARGIAAAAIDPAVLAELLSPAGRVPLRVMPLEELLERAPHVAQPAASLRHRRHPISDASSGRITAKAAILSSRAVAGAELGDGLAIAHAALGELEGLKTAVRKSTGGEVGRAVVTLEAAPPPPPPPPPLSPLPPPSPLRVVRQPPASAPRAASPPALAPPPASLRKSGAGGLSQSKNEASRPRFPEGGASLISTLSTMPRGAPPTLDVPPEAVSFLRAMGLSYDAPPPPQLQQQPGGKRAPERKPPPGPWPEEMFNASQFGVAVSDDRFPSARARLDALRKAQKRELELKKLRRAYSPLKANLPP